MSKLRRIMGKSRRKSRRDNSKRRNEELEWVDFDEDEDFYEDDDEEIDEDEDDYEDDDETDEDEEDYDDDEETDEDEEYYEDEEIDEDEDDYEDDEEEYYEDDDEIDEDEEYYEDEEIDEDEDDYEDDEEEYYEDDDEIDDDEIPDSVFGKMVYKITHMSAVDHIVAFTGAAVLVLAVVTGILYFNARSSKQQIETFAEVGAGIEEIGIIGEAGLLAISDAQAARVMVAEMEQQIAEPVEEKDASGKIEVAMNLTSIQKDLKIKFINKNTGKLIPNISFTVEIERPSGGTYTKEDDDKDGIIYLTDIEAGKYKVKIISPSSDSEYRISSEAVAITVKDTIEYKKVDVADEVKTESQVNAAVEDTKVNETVVESTNTDTVEWVESTKTLVDGTQKDEYSYEKVEKSQIADPGKSASAGFRLLAAVQGDLDGGETGETNPTQEPTQEPTQVPDPTQEPSPTEAPTEEPASTPTVEPTTAATATPEATPAAAVTPTITPTAVPTITPSVSPSVTPSATPSVSPSVSPSATPTATPNGAMTDTKSILKTTSGETLYIKQSDGSYVEAKYADYYTAKEFYCKVTKTTGEYRYTGWQTIDGVTYFFDKNGNKVTGEQVIQGAKYSFNSDGSLNNSSGHLGIDVSKWNGNIDWNAVKSSGVSYVIIRCGYRGSTTGALIEDPMFRSNIQGASKAGLKVGIYFFTQAVNEVEAVEEASMVLSLISGYNITYPVFLDVEASNGRADGINAATRTAVCKAFCQTIQNSGYKAGIYANKTWLNSYIDAPSLTSYRIWLAQYAAAPSYTRTKYDMWQYSSKGRISGISTDVDMNISYMGY